MPESGPNIRPDSGLENCPAFRLGQTRFPSKDCARFWPRNLSREMARPDHSSRGECYQKTAIHLHQNQKRGQLQSCRPLAPCLGGARARLGRPGAKTTRYLPVGPNSFQDFHAAFSLISPKGTTSRGRRIAMRPPKRRRYLVAAFRAEPSQRTPQGGGRSAAGNAARRRWRSL